jgi:nucleotide-binding universal stress UspA family protein
MFKRILVPLKFTPAGWSALEKGLFLAREHGAELQIFHALDFRLKGLNAKDPIIIQKEKETRRRFEAEFQPLLNGFKDYTFGCLPEDPALGVCKLAEHVDADLIVLGSHQQLKKKCLGRVDYVGITILEKAPCPVMLVPPEKSINHRTSAEPGV